MFPTIVLSYPTLITLFISTVLFETTDLKMSTACRICQQPHAWSMEDHTWQVKGMELSYRERMKQRLNVMECGVDLTDVSLTAHCQQQHGVERGEATPPSPQGGAGRRRDNRELGKGP